MIEVACSSERGSLEIIGFARAWITSSTLSNPLDFSFPNVVDSLLVVSAVVLLVEVVGELGSDFESRSAYLGGLRRSSLRWDVMV